MILFFCRQIKFVIPRDIGSVKDEITNDPDDGIFLFTDSDQRLSSKHLLKYDTSMSSSQNVKKQKKPKIKKRKIDDEESEDENTKLRSAAVSFDWVINKSN